jgi:hypothetical protein
MKGWQVIMLVSKSLKRSYDLVHMCIYMLLYHFLHIPAIPEFAVIRYSGPELSLPPFPMDACSKCGNEPCTCTTDTPDLMPGAPGAAEAAEPSDEGGEKEKGGGG